MWRAAPFVVLIACGATDAEMMPTPGPIPFEYPLDDQLRMHEVRAVGTHNSYHLRGELRIRHWDYAHAPLNVQLGTQGVRQFELDVHYNRDSQTFEVYHVGEVDAATNCATFTRCIEVMKRWSDGSPGHYPFVVLLETKTGFDGEDGLGLALQLEALLLEVWPVERLVTPDLVRGNHISLKAAVEAEGWPTLGRVRGRALFVLHDKGGLRSAYTESNTTSAGRVLFPDGGGSLQLPIAAIHTLNDPHADGERIRAAVDAGHLVRTRCDVDGEQARENDFTRFTAALDSGAHFLSTDFPAPVEGSEYWVKIPGGAPLGCNPRSASDLCVAEALEDPRFIAPE